MLLNQPSFFKNKAYSNYSLIIVVVFSIIFSKFLVNWGTYGHPFVMDVNQYYSYLPALFKQHDLTFSYNPNGIWLTKTPIGKEVPMVTYGLAFFYMPYYLLASFLTGNISTGYESAYAWSIHIGCVIYVLIGLYYCKKTLLNWFSEKVTALSLLALFFGSNLFCYTFVNSELSHSILFFLVSLFIYHVINWQKLNSTKHFLISCFLLGFITLIRPTEIISGVLILLIGVYSIKTFTSKINSLLQLKWFFILGVVLFFVPIFPQLLYWKIQSGQWLFFSYGKNERFFWTDPQFLNVLFSYRKGWLIYSPLMILSVLGLIRLYHKNKELFYAVLIYFVINLYVISAWWDWSFGGAFGMRALVQTYALLIIPFAYFIEWIFEVVNSISIKYAMVIIMLFFCFLNIFQTNLYKHGIISYDSMTKEAYWFTFLKKKYTKEELLHLETLLKHPDYAAMRQGYRNQ